MQYPQVVDALRAYWPGEFTAPKTVFQLSLAEAYHGTRRVVEHYGRLVALNLPPGVHSGAHIYLPRTGHEIGRVAEYCAVVVRDQPPFRRVGDDLMLDWIVDVRNLILGGEVQVPTLDGPASLMIPAWTRPGSILRLPGFGMPRIGQAGAHGDLCVHLQVRMPTDASSLERRLIGDVLELKHWHIKQH